ncbi:glycoside hydrolase family 3 protein [Fannyhessea vaginae]|jgi:hypothetical protein|uniref:glycoside hydrolase family 3 protein n=1 Tax=Fannyhessea vaginae TaxID=82135 RepID=UPI0023F3BDC5|nr:glycoside hydrolase family 3 protein [Fannyhessea vaginae]
MLPKSSDLSGKFTHSLSRRQFVSGGIALSALGVGLGFITPIMSRTAFANQKDQNSIAGKDVQTILRAMTRRQKIEQMLMPDFRQWGAKNGQKPSDLTAMNDEVRAALDEFHFGGVILFANNVKETEQTLKLTRDMQAAALQNSKHDPCGDIPLFLTIDQEGGIVYRLGSGTALPGNMAVGATRNPDYAQECGEIIGRELSALGINVNFAPVFDVNNNPSNPVIGLRSFGEKPELVSSMGVAMMKGMQKYNIIATAKHFPGHGDVAVDSHIGLPRVDKTKEQLENLEFIPFKAAVKSGIDMIMTAHIQYPKIETTKVKSTNPKKGEFELPATLSKVIMTDILRTEMGFKGVSVTDALGMGAIAENFTPFDAVKRVFLAGVDIALMPMVLRNTADIDKLRKLIDALEKDKDITDTRLNESVTRILNLKKKRGILDYAKSVKEWATALNFANAQVGSKENRAIERKVSEAAVTVVKNENNVLPFAPTASDKVLLITAFANEIPGVKLAIRRLKHDKVLPEDVVCDVDNYIKTGEETEEQISATVDELKNKIKGYSMVVAVSRVYSAKYLTDKKKSPYSVFATTSLVNACADAKIPISVMSIANPYDAALYTNASAVLCVYGNKGMDPTEKLEPSKAFGPNIPAGIEAIFGGSMPLGKLPVTFYAIKTNASNDAEFDTSTVIMPYGSSVSVISLDQKRAMTTSTNNTTSNGEQTSTPSQENTKPGNSAGNTTQNGASDDDQQNEGKSSGGVNDGSASSGSNTTQNMPQTSDLFNNMATIAATGIGLASVLSGITTRSYKKTVHDSSNNTNTARMQ